MPAPRIQAIAAAGWERQSPSAARERSNRPPEPRTDDRRQCGDFEAATAAPSRRRLPPGLQGRQQQAHRQQRLPERQQHRRRLQPEQLDEHRAGGDQDVRPAGCMPPDSPATFVRSSLSWALACGLIAHAGRVLCPMDCPGSFWRSASALFPTSGAPRRDAPATVPPSR